MRGIAVKMFVMYDLSFLLLYMIRYKRANALDSGQSVSLCVKCCTTTVCLWRERNGKPEASLWGGVLGERVLVQGRLKSHHCIQRGTTTGQLIPGLRAGCQIEDLSPERMP